MRGRLAGRSPVRDGLTLCLCLWFVFWNAYYLTNALLFVDARIYRNAVNLWLAGGDPWSAQSQGLHFAALPMSLPLLIPMGLIPEALFVPVWLAVCIASAVAIVRRLGLDPVWFLFPPLWQGVLLGNPAIPAFALFVWGAEPLGLMVRPHLGFAAIAEGRWRQIALAALVGLVLLLLSPWQMYLRESPAIMARLGVEGMGGANGPGWLYWPAVAATAGVALFDWRAAGWLASTTVAAPIAFHGLVSVMPLRSRAIAAFAAVPLVGIPAAVAFVALGRVLWERRRRAQASGPVAAPAPS